MHASPYFLLVLTSLFWAGNFVLARAMHADIPPITLSFWRWMIAFTLLLPFIIKPVRQQWPLIRQAWRSMVMLALLGITGFNTLIYMAVQYTTATNALLLNAFIPIFTILITWLFMHQHLTKKQLLGVLLSISGVFMIVTKADWQTITGLQFNHGDWLVLLATFAWAVYTVILKGVNPAINRVGLLGVIIFIGTIILVPFYLWELSAGYTTTLTMANIITFAYVGIFPSILAVLFYNNGVAHVGPERASLFIHLMPVFGTLMSIIFLGEQFHYYHAIGISGIFLGIYLTTRKARA